MAKGCLTPAKFSRSCAAALNSVAGTFMPGGCHSRISRGSGMRFGLFWSPKAGRPGFGPETGQGFFEFLDFNVEAEALGFHSSFSVEHHFSGWNQVSSTLMLLAALAMRTKILRLGTAVIVPPWHNPVLLAEEAATLDLLSAGP